MTVITVITAQQLPSLMDQIRFGMCALAAVTQIIAWVDRTTNRPIQWVQFTSTVFLAWALMLLGLGEVVR